MTKKKSKSKKRETAPQAGADYLMIFWMLTVMTTAACELGWWIASALGGRFGLSIATGQLLADVFFFAALVFGLITLLLTPVVYRQRRRSPPPTPIGAFAIIVGLIPIFALFFRAAGG